MTKPVLYKYLTLRLKKDSRLGTIKVKRIKFLLGVLFHVPKGQKTDVIKELEKMGIIKRIDAYNYRVRGTSKGILA